MPLLPFAALAALTLSPASAQRRPPTPEQRIDRLEKQVRQVQKQVFPKGQPADTAGFSDEPAATQDVGQQSQRPARCGRAAAGGHRPPVGRERQSRRGDGGRTGAAARRPGPPLARARNRSRRRAETDGSGSRTSRRKPRRPRQSPRSKPRPKPSRAAVATGDADADAEAAYDEGYQLWNSGKYDAAITSLRAMTKKYPDTAGSAGPTTSSAARCSTRASRAPRPRRCSPITAAIPRASARRTACSISARRW